MTQTSRIRLLIVDDEVAQMEALRHTLGEQGYDVEGCSSGSAALTTLRGCRFDLLLTDLTMPGMDGIALLRAALHVDPMLVCVVMTGAGTIKSAVEAMQAGALDYILKPFRLSAALPVLARALSIRGLRVENADLERRVRERSAELEAANVELDAFTRSASHDLRTPLNAVIGFAGLLRDRYSSHWPEQAQGWLLRIEVAGTRMNRLVEDLLRLSRLGKEALHLDLVDLNALVENVVDELSTEFPGRRGQFVIQTLPSVNADASLVRQVFLNLLSNALKFTGRTAQPLIEVSASSRDNENTICVRDNGSGFDMAVADRLFVPFQRLHKEQEFEGTGVGLSLVQRIVLRHGGRVWAKGTPEQGAMFCFTLG